MTLDIDPQIRDVAIAVYGLTEAELRLVAEQPDLTDEVLVDKDSKAQFLVKKLQRGTMEIFVLCELRIQGDHAAIMLAFAIRPELIATIGTSEPLILLQAIAQNFGLPLRVGKQLSKFIFRELLPVPSGLADPLKLVEVLAPPETPFQYYCAFRHVVEANARYLEVNYAFAIDTYRYVNWLSGRDPAKACHFGIAPSLRGQITPFDLLRGEGALTFRILRSSILAGTLFEISSPSFIFLAAFSDDAMYGVRNTQKITKTLPPVGDVDYEILCFFIWSSTHLSLSLLPYPPMSSSAKEHFAPTKAELGVIYEQGTVQINTPETFPPPDLLQYAREQTIAPQRFYQSNGDFYEAVASAILSIEDRVQTLEAKSAFWDVQYDGSRIVKRLPKKETDIHPSINSMLWDLDAISKCFREHQRG